MNVLVSGVAGDIGLGVGRILKDSHWPGNLYGMDIHADHPGLFIFEYCVVAPMASSPDYIDWLEDYIRSNNIKIFIPTSEAEISIIAAHQLEYIGDASILISNNFMIEKSLDKNECLNYLSKCCVEVPAHGIVGVDIPTSYPIIVKPRSGQGGKGVRAVYSEVEYSTIPIGGMVWQEYLAPDDEEYTCPVYRTLSHGARVLILKRQLSGGSTYKGVVVTNEQILQYVLRVAESMQLRGVMNVQLRFTARGPLLFEINPRLSSTLVFRDKMGFCDLRWWLAELTGGQAQDYIQPKAGTRFYRGAQEYIL